jgi:hypothetical protein
MTDAKVKLLQELTVCLLLPYDGSRASHSLDYADFKTLHFSCLFFKSLLAHSLQRRMLRKTEYMDEQSLVSPPGIQRARVCSPLL